MRWPKITTHCGGGAAEPAGATPFEWDLQRRIDDGTVLPFQRCSRIYGRAGSNRIGFGGGGGIRREGAVRQVFEGPFAERLISAHFCQ